MARAKLSAAAVAALRKPGLHGVGEGLYLRIDAAGHRRWVLRYKRRGVPRYMGLGPAPDGRASKSVVSLADARNKASEARQALLEERDPIEARRQRRALEESQSLTFRQASENYIAAHRTGWRNAKHAAQWQATLSTYAWPVLGDLPVCQVDRPRIVKVLKPIWATKNETARRVRGRIEAILDAATAAGDRDGENPARWSVLKHLLAKRQRLAIKHHSALPWREIGDFMTGLLLQDGTAPRALEFAILTAARTGEVLGATWDEFDLHAALWIVPAGRMKGAREHRVPLSPRAVEIIRTQAKVRESDFVFPGARRGRPLSNMALLMTLRRMGRGDLTAHGFRSSFRDWASETTGYAHEIPGGGARSRHRRQDRGRLCARGFTREATTAHERMVSSLRAHVAVN
jgi:integrase